MLNSTRTFLSSLLLLVSATLFAQEGASTAGAARTKYLGNLGILPASREVAVEDFVNYHRHEIGRPKAGESVALDLRWGNNVFDSNQEAVLQVGISTALVHDRKQLRPLNLALVIDNSGSMSEDNKLVRVKQALHTLVARLRPSDTLSITVFDSDAEVVLPAQEVRDGHAAQSIIDEIRPGSTTNLDGGLMLGYQEALKHYNKEATNRVILLTDGIANRGVIDPQEIAKDSLKFNDKGIDLSTIGVGQDLNKDLLSTLAKSGHGLFHFVADSEDIQKVFDKEVQSLLSPIASDATLEIDFDHRVGLEQVYGYSPQIASNKVTIKLDTMNSGMTEVVLLKMKKRPVVSLRNWPVRAKLTYFDLDGNKSVESIQSIDIPGGKSEKETSVRDESVSKNYSIAMVAQSIRDMASACEKHQFRKAESLLSDSITKISNEYPNQDDPDVKRVLDTAKKYREVLRKDYENNDKKEDDNDRPEVAGKNLIVNGDFSLGNFGFTSPGLPFVSPSDNCLWPCAYTISPQFNSPHLHRLIANEDYRIAKLPSGKSQMFYANAGGTDAMVIWSQEVDCKPNTTYQISFEGISLTPGAEYIPTYQIQVNGENSNPQAAGEQHFNPIGMTWNSGTCRRVTVNIVKMASSHNIGIIGIGNIKMVKVQAGL